MSWDYSLLLKYMSNRPKFYGDKWKFIISSDYSFLAKCFTDSVLKHLDLSTQLCLPFVHILYEGKGDPCGVTVDTDFCFTDLQITELMNFLCCYDSDEDFRYFLSDYVSFKIEMYLLHSFSLYKDWISFLRSTFS